MRRRKTIGNLGRETTRSAESSAWAAGVVAVGAASRSADRPPRPTSSHSNHTQVRLKYFGAYTDNILGVVDSLEGIKITNQE